MVRDFSSRKVKISHRTVNPPTEYKQFNHKPAPDFKVQCQQKGCLLRRILPLKKQIFEFLGIVKCSKNMEFSVSYYRNMEFF
jgi:hypothetical protein